MLCQFDLNAFWNERVAPRKQLAQSKLRDVLLGYFECAVWFEFFLYY